MASDSDSLAVDSLQQEAIPAVEGQQTTAESGAPDETNAAPKATPKEPSAATKEEE